MHAKWVARRRVSWLLALACLSSARLEAAELYRCADSQRYVDRPARCAEARAHDPKGNVVKLAPARPAAEGRGLGELDLEELLPEPPSGWSVVEEAPTDPRLDPDFLRWGVVGQRARHYTRAATGGVQVCSVEIWAFHSAEAVGAVLVHMRRPGWKLTQRGPLLLLLRGLDRGRPPGSRWVVFPECRQLGEGVLRGLDARGGSRRPDE